MNRNVLPVEPQPMADQCPHCGVDLERHLVSLDGHVFVCEVCMHELPTPVPNQRRSSGTTSRPFPHTLLQRPAGRPTVR